MIQELKDTLAQAQTLCGLLPICSHCKKIRDEKGRWHALETSHFRAFPQAVAAHSTAAMAPRTSTPNSCRKPGFS